MSDAVSNSISSSNYQPASTSSSSFNLSVAVSYSNTYSDQSKTSACSCSIHFSMEVSYSNPPSDQNKHHHPLLYLFCQSIKYIKYIIKIHLLTTRKHSPIHLPSTCLGQYHIQIHLVTMSKYQHPLPLSTCHK